MNGDITTPDQMGLHVEAIVNAANERLAAGSGVCGAIFAAAGRSELAGACRDLAPCPTGSAVSTPSFGLSAQGITWVIHAVGPDTRVFSLKESTRLLEETYVSILAEAAALGVRSLAVPSISTGIYGFPVDVAAQIAVTTISQWQGLPDEVALVAFDQDSADVLTGAVATSIVK